MTLALRPYLDSDLNALVKLYRSSIEILGAEDYSESQCAAWADLADDTEEFSARLLCALTLLALNKGVLAGFASLKGAKIDMLYVEPKFARTGVASTLLEALEKLAGARSIGALEVDASDVAREFFVKRGYEALQRNSVLIQDEWFANTTMRKNLIRNNNNANHGS